MTEIEMDRGRAAWRVALAGALALAVAMGIGRFAFTPLLPMMLHDGVIDLAAGGWLALILTALVWSAFSGTATAASTPIAATHDLEPTQVTRQTRGLTLAYALAGFGYIITATFLPVIARQALPGSNWPDLFWPLFGICVSVGALLATRLPAHWDNRLQLAACYLLQACGIFIGIASPSVSGFALGSILLGLPFTAITLFAMRDARRLRGDHARSLMGLLTAAYGVGQIIGPPLATRLVQRSGSFNSSLSVAALALLAGAALFFVMYSQSRKPNS
jgi:predicted MFS family arabinose efflux permease